MLTLSVCIGSACHIKGSYNVISTFQQMIEQHHLADKIELKAAFCLRHCQKAVCVMIGESLDAEFFSVSGATAREFFENTVMPRLAE